MVAPSQLLTLRTHPVATDHHRLHLQLSDKQLPWQLEASLLALLFVPDEIWVDVAALQGFQLVGELER